MQTSRWFTSFGVLTLLIFNFQMAKAQSQEKNVVDHLAEQLFTAYDPNAGPQEQQEASEFLHQNFKKLKAKKKKEVYRAAHQLALSSNQTALARKFLRRSSDGTKKIVSVSPETVSKPQSSESMNVSLEPPTLISFCNDEQIGKAFLSSLNSLRAMEPSKKKTSSLLVYNEGECRIRGIVSKAESGFEFAPTNRFGRPQTPTLFFRDTLEIIRLYQAGQMPLHLQRQRAQAYGPIAPTSTMADSPAPPPQHPSGAMPPPEHPRIQRGRMFGAP